MEEMIAKIVEMDKKAREMNEKAQKTKLSYENEVLLTKEKIRKSKQTYCHQPADRTETCR